MNLFIIVNYLCFNNPKIKNTKEEIYNKLLKRSILCKCIKIDFKFVESFD